VPVQDGGLIGLAVPGAGPAGSTAQHERADRIGRRAVLDRELVGS
jgi:hypothetical protein